jgi:hypothetical protein
MLRCLAHERRTTARHMQPKEANRVTGELRTKEMRPNPSLSPRPTTAGQLARVARWFMLHHTGKPSRLRGRCQLKR